MTEQYWADAATKNCVWCFQVSRTKWLDDEGIDFWHTEKVFLSRKEALAFGDSQKHNYGEFNDGWRIWGVPCEGKMAELLGLHNKEFEEDVEYITERK